MSAGEEVGQHIGIPPYGVADDPASGLKCYVCNTFETKSWSSMMHHLRRKHKVQQSTLKGSHLYTMATEEDAAKARLKYKAHKQHDAEDSSHGANVKVEAGQSNGAARKPTSVMNAKAAASKDESAGPQSAGAGEGAEGGHAIFKSNDDDTVETNPDGSYWQAYWVRVGVAGSPLEPLVMFPALSGDDTPGTSANVKPGSATAAASQPSNVQAAAIARQPPADTPTKASWTSMLPVVAMKDLYENGIMLPDSSKPGGRASGWPVKTVPAVDIDEFFKWCAVEHGHGAGALNDIKRNLHRFLHMLEGSGGEDVDAATASDPMFIVAVYMNDLHKLIFSSKLMNPAFSWSRKMLDAVKFFAEFQKTKAAKKRLETDDGVWSRAESAIDQLLVSLKGGFSKAMSAEKTKRIALRRVRDAEVIQDFPPVDIMKQAVMKAMVTLHTIYTTYCKSARLPREAQSAATASMVGILYYNGFGGRKAEWEVMLKCYVQERVDQGMDFVVCQWHKTSHLYGSLAKWLAPGTVAAVKVYLRLPRNSSVIHFLSPCDDGVTYADVPHYMHRFAELFLSKKYSSPTVNLFRKWYHTELVRTHMFDVLVRCCTSFSTGLLYGQHLFVCWKMLRKVCNYKQHTQHHAERVCTLFANCVITYHNY